MSMLISQLKCIQLDAFLPVCHQWSRHGTWNRSWTQCSVSWSQCSPARNIYL